MIPVLFKKNEQQFRTYGLGEVTDIINPKVTRERNGQYLLYFQYPQNTELSDVFEEDMRIKSDAGVRTKWQTFEISRVIRKEGQLIEVFAKHISQSLLKDALNPSVNIRSSSAQQALRIWNNNRIGDEEFDVWSDISTTSSTNWSIQDVSNAFEALAGVQGSILDVWGGEYEFDNKMIRLHKEMGRKSPVPLEYGRNITGLEQDQQDDNVYTSIYPFATYTPEGDNEPKTVTLPEHYIDGKYLEMHNKRKIQVVDFSAEFENNDIPTVSRLRTLAKQYAETNEVGLPHENLKVEYIDLSKTLDYQEFQTMEEVELNDRLPYFYPKFGITNENAKVVVINYDPVKEENISIELGVIGQSFRTVTTGGIDSRLDRVEKQQKETVNYIVNAKGNRIWFETPAENMEHKIGDTWFEKNGPYDRIRVWNGNQWEVIIDTEDIDKIAKEVEQAQQEIAEAQATADEAVEQIDTAVANAGFTSLDETISSVQSISNQAQINAGAAIDDALEAMTQASIAVENTGSLNVRVDEVEDTLSLKADKQTVDDLTGVVDLQALDIKANADGLKLKANQDTVDLIDGRVSSLGTEVSAVAGQISNKVWKTDIESAVDGIEVGGRNYLRNSDFSNSFKHWYSNSDAEVVELDGVTGVKITANSGIHTDPTILDPNIEYTLSFSAKSLEGSSSIRAGFLNQTNMSVITSLDGDIKRYSVTFHGKLDLSRNMFFHVYRNQGSIFIADIKLEKGNKATDWTPAPEDTDAKISHIETEWTQTFDSFSQTVSGIDGRVTNIRHDVDGITETVTDQTGRIATVERNVNGIQQTVSDPVNGLVTQVSTLASGFNVLAKDVSDIPVWKRVLPRASQNEPVELTYPDGKSLSNNSSYDIYLSAESGTSVNNYSIYTYNNGDLKLVNRSGVQVDASAFLDGNKVMVETHYSNATQPYPYTATVTEQSSKGGKSSLSVLNDNINLRVEKGDVINQINISDESILLQANRIQALGDVVVDGKLTITDEFIAPNAQIDGAKIADATIGSAKIANIDASKITTGELKGVHVYAKTGEIGDWTLNEGMLYSLVDGKYTTLKATGAVALAAGSPNYYTTTDAALQIWHDGKLRWYGGQGLIWSGNKAGLVIESSEWLRLRPTATVEVDGRLISRNNAIDDLGVYGNEWDNVVAQSFRISSVGVLQRLGGTSTASLELYARNDLILKPSGFIRSMADIRPYSNGNYHLGGADYRWSRVWTVNGVSESSDARLKNNIVDIPSKLLNGISQVEPKMYEMNGKTKFGYIAQDVERELFKYAAQVVGSKNASEYIKQFDVLDKNDESYQALMYSQMEVLKGAYRDKKIKELENRIKELENAS